MKGAGKPAEADDGQANGEGGLANGEAGLTPGAAGPKRPDEHEGCPMREDDWWGQANGPGRCDGLACLYGNGTA